MHIVTKDSTRVLFVTHSVSFICFTLLDSASQGTSENPPPSDRGCDHALFFPPLHIFPPPPEFEIAEHVTLETNVSLHKRLKHLLLTAGMRCAWKALANS